MDLSPGILARRAIVPSLWHALPGCCQTRVLQACDAGDGVIVSADVEGPDLHSRLAELAELHEVAGVDVGG